MRRLLLSGVVLALLAALLFGVMFALSPTPVASASLLLNPTPICITGTGTTTPRISRLSILPSSGNPDE